MYRVSRNRRAEASEARRFRVRRCGGGSFGNSRDEDTRTRDDDNMKIGATGIATAVLFGFLQAGCDTDIPPGMAQVQRNQSFLYMSIWNQGAVPHWWVSSNLNVPPGTRTIRLKYHSASGGTSNLAEIKAVLAAGHRYDAKYITTSPYTVVFWIEDMADGTVVGGDAPSLSERCRRYKIPRFLAGPPAWCDKFPEPN